MGSSNKVQDVLREKVPPMAEASAGSADFKKGKGRRRLYREESCAQLADSIESGTRAETTERPSSPAGELVVTDQTEAAKKIIEKHVYLSMGLGVLPLPLTDVFGGVALQLQMIQQLSKLYGVPFVFSQEKYALSSLLSGFLTEMVLTKGSMGLMRLIPGISWTLRLATMPFLFGSYTYAVGMVFFHHFQQGGTFQNLDRAKIKEHLQKEFKKGKGVVSKVKSPSF